MYVFSNYCFLFLYCSLSLSPFFSFFNSFSAYSLTCPKLFAYSFSSNSASSSKFSSLCTSSVSSKFSQSSFPSTFFFSLPPSHVSFTSLLSSCASMGARSRDKELCCRTGPPGYTALRNWFLGIDSWAPVRSLKLLALDFISPL
jgi:hypothetical protein